jgi:peptidoglycan hydrolase-like protein with peptidoglycan-binding domain
MLIWTGDYDGIVDGVEGEETRHAVKGFQRQLGHPETAKLTEQEVSLLRKRGLKTKQAVGFKEVDDPITGVSVGMPLNLVSAPVKKIWGQNWSAPADRINIDTFRYTDVTLQEVFNKLMTFRHRRIDYFRFKESWFVVSGTDRDGSAIYVRAVEQKSSGPGVLPEIRGFSVRIEAASRNELQRIPIAMSSTFNIIPIGGKINASAGPSNDLLRTPTRVLNEKQLYRASQEGPRVCLNGLGNCPPQITPCLKGSGECPASLSGE